MGEMKFYIEYDTEAKMTAEMTTDGHTSILAEKAGVFYGSRQWRGIGTVSVMPQYLEKFCTEVSEEEARRLWPALFVYLEKQEVL